MAAAKYTNDQVALFQKFIRSGYSIEDVKNPRFTSLQLNELYLGKKAGIDISMYNSPDVSADVMRRLRLLDKKGFELESLAETVTESGKYDRKQALQILDAAKHGVNIKNMLDPELDHMQMRQIKLGERYGVDTSVYATPDFTAEQMKMLRVEMIIRKVLDTIKEFFQETWEKFTDLIHRDVGNKAAQENFTAEEASESSLFDVLYNKVGQRVNEQLERMENNQLVNEGTIDFQAAAQEAAKDIDRYYENFDKTIDEAELMAEEQMAENYERYEFDMEM